MSMIVSAHISDIHFGAFDSKRLLLELKNNFINKIKKMPKLNVIFIQGDLYDFELLNSNTVYHSNQFIEMVLSIAEKKTTKVRIIKGTKSHDHNQLWNLSFIFGKYDVDVKIIDTVSVEEIYEDYKVLYLPEEYMKDYKEYYKDYFDDEYDAIVGHGMFEETAFKDKNKKALRRPPVFNSKDMLKICRGAIHFGHIHYATYILNRIFYSGSFSRWIMGEEDPKGFYFCIYNTETYNFRIVPIINTMARKFITKTITKIIRKHDIQEVIDNIDAYVSKRNIYKLRLKCHELDDNVYMSKLNILRNYFSNNKAIDFVIDKMTLNVNTDEEELLDRYDYLFDNQLEYEDKVAIFINNEYDINISSDRVKDILYTDIIESINRED